MEQLEQNPIEKTMLKKTPLEPSVMLPENQEESPPAVHSEPTTVSLKAKLANLNLADIKPFYPRSEREQERQKQEAFERSLYAEVASRNYPAVRQVSEREDLHSSLPADRIIQMTEKELLEEQLRMHQQRESGYIEHSPVVEPFSRRGYSRSFEDMSLPTSHHHMHHQNSPVHPSIRASSGMELLEKNLERHDRDQNVESHDRDQNVESHDRDQNVERHDRDQFVERHDRDQFVERRSDHLYRPTSNRLIRSTRERGDFDLWADYKKDRPRHFGYSSRGSYPAHSSRQRSNLSMSERELPHYSRNISSNFSDYPSRSLRRPRSRLSESSRYHSDLMDYDFYRYEELCNSDPVYEDPTQDNEFFMYQMMAAEENAKREKLCGVAAVVPPDQVTKASAPKKETQKSRICRHFLRGHCKFGESCNFFHGAPLVHASDQLVFLGGLPSGITSDMLSQELNRAYGVEVLNKPQIFSNFSPRVALSLDDAKLLKGHGKLNIFNRQVDVRPFEDNSKSEAEKCMVFLGGLPEGIKLTELISQLRKKGIQVMNKPYLGEGYARNVQVQSEKHANDLIRKRKIFLFSSSVDVRPYVNVYGKKKDDDNGTVIPLSELPPRKNVATSVSTSDRATSPSTSDPQKNTEKVEENKAEKNV